MKNILFKSPIGRLVFLGRYILSGILMLTGAFATDSPKVSDIFIAFASVVFIGGAIYMVFFAIVPRLVSVGLSKWFALLALIPPIYPVIFLFLGLCPEGQFVKHETVA